MHDFDSEDNAMTDVRFEGSLGKIPDSHYAAIGKVAAYWTKLEQIVDANLIGIAGLRSDVGVCFAAQIPVIHRKLVAFAAIADLRKTPKKLIDELNKFINNVNELAHRRNRIIHDDWYSSDETGSMHRLQTTSDKRLVYEWKPMTSEQVDDVARQISDCWMTFINLAQRIENEAQSLPSTPTSPSPLVIPVQSNQDYPNPDKR